MFCHSERKSLGLPSQVEVVDEDFVQREIRLVPVPVPGEEFVGQRGTHFEPGKGQPGRTDLRAVTRKHAHPPIAGKQSFVPVHHPAAMIEIELPRVRGLLSPKQGRQSEKENKNGKQTSHTKLSGLQWKEYRRIRSDGQIPVTPWYGENQGMTGIRRERPAHAGRRYSMGGGGGGRRICAPG
jgi:hypothetical protein